MDYYALAPEVAAELGPGTVMDVAVHPPIVSQLHLVFEVWLGDPLIECFPIFAVTDDLADRLQSNSLSGFRILPVTITDTAERIELDPGKPLPSFRWLDVFGVAGRADVGTDSRRNLVVSSRALEVLHQEQIAHCEIHPFIVNESTGT
jgi:hypothetical protein